MNIPEIRPYPMPTPAMTQAEHYNRMVEWIAATNRTIAAINDRMRDVADRYERHGVVLPTGPTPPGGAAQPRR